MQLLINLIVARMPFPGFVFWLISINICRSDLFELISQFNELGIYLLFSVEKFKRFHLRRESICVEVAFISSL